MGQEEGPLPAQLLALWDAAHAGHDVEVLEPEKAEVTQGASTGA